MECHGPNVNVLWQRNPDGRTSGVDNSFMQTIPNCLGRYSYIWKLFHKEVAFLKRLCRAGKTIYRSCECVVDIERPPPLLHFPHFGNSSTCTVDTFKVRTLCLWSMPVCNIPTPLFIYSGVRRLLKFWSIIMKMTQTPKCGVSTMTQEIRHVLYTCSQNPDIRQFQTSRASRVAIRVGK